MLVKDLIQKLQKVDPKMLVMCTSNTGEYDYGIVNNAKVLSLRLDDYESDKDNETDCFVISEE